MNEKTYSVDFFRKSGRKGGLKTKKKYGKEHYQKLAAKTNAKKRKSK